MSGEAARRGIDKFFEGFNDEDEARIHEALNFPHVRISSGTVRVIEGPGHFKTPFGRLKRIEGWHHSTLDRSDVIHEGENKAHFDVAFTRFREDGTASKDLRALQDLFGEPPDAVENV